MLFTMSDTSLLPAMSRDVKELHEKAAVYQNVNSHL